MVGQEAVDGLLLFLLWSRGGLSFLPPVMYGGERGRGRVRRGWVGGRGLGLVLFPRSLQVEDGDCWGRVGWVWWVG